jgi:CcmD family protein
MDPNAGYVVAGYVITGVALGGYTFRLFVRARRARERADAVAGRRRGERI